MKKMQLFEIWSPRWVATGEDYPACKIGEVEAENFDEACIKLLGDALDKEDDGSYTRIKISFLAPKAGIKRIEWFNDKNVGYYSYGRQALFPSKRQAVRYS